MRMLDHSYARTSFREQGATNDREIIAISAIDAKVFDRRAAYVAATRAKDNTEVITSDPKTVLKKSGQDVSKTTALRGPDVREIVASQRAEAERFNEQLKPKRQDRSFQLTR